MKKVKKNLYAEFAKTWDIYIDNYEDEIDFDTIKHYVKLRYKFGLPNELIKIASMPLLKEKGQVFNVKSGKKDNRFYQNNKCFANAAIMMIERGYSYVEGLFKFDGFTFAHAWNVDLQGNHIDFTLDAEGSEYLGIIIPKSLVYDIGYEKGCIWSAALPFIDEVLLNKYN